MVAVLTPYRETIFFPGGNPAIGADVLVTLDGSNVLPSLFSDAAATLPIGNVITADGTGTIQFYAAPGCYLGVLAGTSARVPVQVGHPDPVFSNLYVHTEPAPAAVWTIDHWLGVEPAVDILLSGDAVEADITHPTVNRTVITLSQPLAGVAQLRR